MSKKAAFWIFLLGTLSSAVLFLGLTWDMHRQVDVLSRADNLSDVETGANSTLKFVVMCKESGEESPCQGGLNRKRYPWKWKILS